MELGHVDVDRMLEEMTVETFNEWRVFFNWRERQREEALSKQK